ncbi:coenzyme F390 synthetase [Enterobacter cloacae subsp. cloacae]|uniref:F390 synthetase-related protein n=1 Tax=Enterobacter cloacae TaxID=550 RepID=UPI00063AF497|nr:F390 synthetase-related protein [Enterobacter cloacae]KLG14312.1 coenzyme F390 synthetase [Enterobacter cloacae subsp. cloacae]
MNSLMLIWRYFCIRQRRFTDREKLVNWQAKKMHHFRQRVLTKSPWFQRFLSQPFSHWPLMDKAQMMIHFDAMNTERLKRDELMACALKSEDSRDFSPKIGCFSVGLSSGTSGRRGLFVVSQKEQQVWAAGILARVLPDGLFARERVALFLRANNNLYQSVTSRWLSLQFYDLLAPFQQHLSRLEHFCPTIVVAPAQVLRALALAVRDGSLKIQVKKVISVAEVLEEQDRELLNQVFGSVGEIYQATEGFLASTCAFGTLHLNEEFIHVEPQWLDRKRFIPIITDFTRSTQPIVRYRLDDVLVVKDEACLCKSATRAIERIEGRQDDQLLLPDRSDNLRTIFADACSRMLALSLPLTADYRLVQTKKEHLLLMADCEMLILTQCRNALNDFFELQGIDTSRLAWTLETKVIAPRFDVKRRRIIRQWGKE